MKVYRVYLYLFIVATVFLASKGYAQVSSSTNYAIERDSINFGGGYASSTNFEADVTFGEVGTGYSSSTNYTVHAGYQQVDESYLSLSVVPDVTMSPNIGGVSGGVATGTTFVIATTDAPAGYQLFIKASSTPAMTKGADTIADYVPAGAVPDAVFMTGSTEAHMGYSIGGLDVVDDFKVTAGVCGSGASVSGSCWDGLSTIDRLIAEGGANFPTGATTTIDFQVGVGSAALVPAGTYKATTTLTLIAL